MNQNINYYEDDFWRRVQKVDDQDACRLWLGPINPQTGYGGVSLPQMAQVAFGLRRSVTAAMLACAIVHGPRPAGGMVLHSCDNPPCCNPRHLRWGTSKENHEDAVAKGRKTWGVRLPLSGPCKRGHTGRWKRDANGRRLCMDCAKESDRQRRQRRAAARAMEQAG